MKTDPKESQPGSRRERLLAEFPAATHEQWRAAAEALLKGAPFEKRLITRTPEGIDLQPIYRREDVAALPQVEDLPGCGSRLRGSDPAGVVARAWEISQELPLATPEEFNSAALADLERGQTELNIPLDGATLSGRDPDQATAGEVGACGLSLATLADLDKALAGVHLPMISVYLQAGASALPVAALLFALAKKRGIDPKQLRGCIESDPLGMLAWKGSLPVSLDRAWLEMAALASHAAREAPGLKTVAVQGQPYHDAGASAVQELAFALATGLQYLRELAARGVPVDTAAHQVRFSLAAGSNFFMEVAKFRAARLLWSRIVAALGGDEAARAMHLHVRTSTFNKTAYDAHTNMLRTTTEAFSAVVGGCNSLHVGPYDEVVRQPDEFSRRIARNTQVILAEECDLTRVIDPAGGSHYVEWLTNEVAARAWTLFQEIEKLGGMAAALVAGFPQKAVAETARGRADAVAKRRSVIVGANQYANAREERLASSAPDYAAIQRKRGAQIAGHRTQLGNAANTTVLASLAALLEAGTDAALAAATDAVLKGATLGEICRTLRANDAAAASITPLAIHRAAQVFERLRDASAAFKQKTGAAPLLFQANIGPSRLYRLRADWTTGFFEVGGFKVAADRDFKDADEAATAALASGARIVVITSMDDTYPTAVEPLARAVKAKDAGIHVLVAGAAPKEKETEAAWRAAGVDGFVNVASNALELLTSLLTRIGVLS